MPAYRSAAEAEVRDAVVTRLRDIMPDARIIHEINACGFGNRIDVLAVGPTKIMAVEIKSEKDKLDRLRDQVKAMRGVAHTVVAAIHEKFLIETLGNTYPPNEASGAVVWAYPRRDRAGHVECQQSWFASRNWDKPSLNLPPRAIHMLWRQELVAIVRGFGGTGVARLTMDECVDAIRWHMTGAQITRSICAALRARKCVEADPEIIEGVAA